MEVISDLFLGQIEILRKFKTLLSPIFIYSRSKLLTSHIPPACSPIVDIKKKKMRTVAT